MFPRFKIKEICCAFSARFFIVAILLLSPDFLNDLKANAVAVNENDRNAEITLFRVSPADELGIYKYAYETSNSIKVQAAGSAIEQIGLFSYISPEGIPIEVRYIADELGFHAVGRHLPKPPPIPDYILRSLEYIRTHPNQENRGANRIW